MTESLLCPSWAWKPRSGGKHVPLPCSRSCSGTFFPTHSHSRSLPASPALRSERRLLSRVRSSPGLRKEPFGKSPELAFTHALRPWAMYDHAPRDVNVTIVSRSSAVRFAVSLAANVQPTVHLPLEDAPSNHNSWREALALAGYGACLKRIKRDLASSGVNGIIYSIHCC